MKRIISLGIQYQKCKNGDVLHCFSNVNWVNDKDIKRSTCDYYFILDDIEFFFRAIINKHLDLSST